MSLRRQEEDSAVYGRCDQGVRHVPVKLLDVAGLIPGASEGAGLGNKFLDDLRHAHVLMHIIDVSGRTNEKGEETIGYDPINDADWLQEEIRSWVFNNLWRKWGSIARRHQATKSSLLNTFVAQLSGYGASPSLIATMLDKFGAKDPCDLTAWGETEVHDLVSHFLDIRFPTILVLNKADQGDETDKNIEHIAEKYGSDRCFVSSAAAECFLRAAAKQQFIRYEPGSMFYSTLDDESDGPPVDENTGKQLQTLKPLEKKISKRLERISDMVLFRYGSTGVRAAINAAVELSNTVVVYPVKSLKNFSTDGNGKGVFADAVFVRRGATIRELAYRVSQFVGANFAYAEGEDGRRLGEDEPILTSNLIVKFSTTVLLSAGGTSEKKSIDVVSSKQQH